MKNQPFKNPSNKWIQGGKIIPYLSFDRSDLLPPLDHGQGVLLGWCEKHARSCDRSKGRHGENFPLDRRRRR
jgi:hypothetical protein